MKFTLDWLRTHLETEAPLETIAATLSAIGLEVERVEDRGAALAPFVVAHVIEATPHPNADRLRVCRVDTGTGETQVVCGAPNARTGMRAVFAPPGSQIPGTGLTLTPSEIRGVKSAGMLVSARELALGEDHDGIIDLAADAPVGTRYATYAGLDDPLIEIGVTPNRGDALGVRGIARDLAAAGLGALKPWAAPAIAGAGPSATAWRIEDIAGCPWILGRTIRDVRNGPSPDWLQRRLTAIGLRPISALVDVTNFFTHDLGRPLHVFDADRIAGPMLTLRRGAGETFRGLNNADITTTTDDLVIADSTGAVSLAGIVGGERTGSTHETRTVFLECALFDPVRIALSGRRHRIHTDSRARFERGVDQSFLPAALDAATALILELCGGVPSEVAQAGAEPGWRRTARLRFSRLASLGGAQVAPGRAAAILDALGFQAQSNDAESITVAVPPWRNEIAQDAPLIAAPSLPPDRAEEAAEGARQTEAEHDLVEEVLRIDGLDRIPPVSMPRAAPIPRPTLTEAQSRTERLRRRLAADGYAECVTFSFCARARAAQFGPTPDALTLANPIAADLDQLRPTPLATLAEAARRNLRQGAADVRLFEIGPAYLDSGQTLVAAALRAGPAPRDWRGGAGRPDAFSAKQDALAALEALGIARDTLTVSTDAPAHYHPGRSGTLRQGPKIALGHFGELHPALAAALDLEPAAAFELHLDALPAPRKRKRSAPDLPSLQPVRRDFAFLLPRAVPADAVLRAARAADRQLIAAARLFDVYEGDQIDAAEKSLAIEVTLQPVSRTLTDADIDLIGARIVAAVEKATGGRLRQ